MSITLIFAGLCALFTTGLVVSEVADIPVGRTVCKPAASLAFLGVGFGSGAFTVAPHGTVTLAALILSLVGDVALLSTDKRWFKAGIGAFLLAHVAYVVAFIQIGVSPLGTALAVIPVAGLAAVVWRWLAPHVGPMRRPVQAYVAVISGMVAFAVGAAVAAPTTPHLVLLAAAVLFFSSDLFVARNRFVKKQAINRVIGLPLYYVAQVLFAWMLASA